MALINCPECSKQISDTSQKCIGCGFKINDVEKKSNKKLEIILISIGVVTLIVAVFYSTNNSGNESNSSSNNSKDIYSNFTPSQTKIDESISIELVDDPKFNWNLVNEIDHINEGKAYDIDGNYLGSFSSNGQKNGIWKQYYKGSYPFESLNKIQNLAYEGNYTDGMMNGHFKHYYPNGNIKHEGLYVNGSYELNENSGIPQGGREGLHIFYFNNGGFCTKQFHKNGNQVGDYQEWDKFGNCIRNGKW